MGEGGGGAEGELEGGFEEVAAENHEVVAVAVLRLHDLGGMQGGGRHVMGVRRFAERVVRVCVHIHKGVSVWPVRIGCSARLYQGHQLTMIFQLLEPHGMDKIALLVIWSLPP